MSAYTKTHSIAGKTVFVRVDFNVPLSKDGKRTITDDTRIVKALPTINLLTQQGAKVVLVTHLGKPKGPDPKLTLDPVAARLSELVGKKVTKVDEVVGESVKKAVGAMKNGDIVLLENVRFNPGETKNKPEFVKQLVDCIHPDIYVNDAFGTAHRAHASTVGVTAYTKVNLSGLLMDKELKFLYGAIDNPKRPLAAIVGGAKVSTKLPVLESLIDKCDKLLVGGGMMFTFYKAMGKNIGKSIVENDQLDLALKLMDKAKTKGIEFMLPVDTVVTDSLDKQAVIKTVDVDHIPSDCLGADIGPKTIAAFQKTLEDANTIVWNGPMGIFEQKNFAAGTMAIAKTLAERSDKGAITIVGGGDSVSAINKSGVANKITHISTGGGASLEVLEGKILPGVAALTDA